MALGRTHLPDLEGRINAMSVADQRIAVKDKKTGELGHAIKGHVPAGWEVVKDQPVRKK